MTSGSCLDRSATGVTSFICRLSRQTLQRRCSTRCYATSTLTLTKMYVGWSEPASSKPPNMGMSACARSGAFWSGLPRPIRKYCTERRACVVAIGASGPLMNAGRNTGFLSSRCDHAICGLAIGLFRAIGTQHDRKPLDSVTCSNGEKASRSFCDVYIPNQPATATTQEMHGDSEKRDGIFCLRFS